MVMKSQISSQYIGQKQISTTILHVISPSHFILKESPSLNTSSEVKNFMETEESMQKYYESNEPHFFQMPLKDAVQPSSQPVNKFLKLQERRRLLRQRRELQESQHVDPRISSNVENKISENGETNAFKRSPNKSEIEGKSSTISNGINGSSNVLDTNIPKHSNNSCISGESIHPVSETSKQENKSAEKVQPSQTMNKFLKLQERRRFLRQQRELQECSRRVDPKISNVENISENKENAFKKSPNKPEMEAENSAFNNGINRVSNVLGTNVSEHSNNSYISDGLVHPVSETLMQKNKSAEKVQPSQTMNKFLKLQERRRFLRQQRELQVCSPRVDPKISSIVENKISENEENTFKKSPNKPEMEAKNSTFNNGINHVSNVLDSNIAEHSNNSYISDGLVHPVSEILLQENTSTTEKESKPIETTSLPKRKVDYRKYRELYRRHRLSKILVKETDSPTCTESALKESKMPQDNGASKMPESEQSHLITHCENKSPEINRCTASDKAEISCKFVTGDCKSQVAVNDHLKSPVEKLIPDQPIDSEILKAVAAGSDNDDILCATSKKKNFSDDSDVDDSYIYACTKPQSPSMHKIDFTGKSLWEKQKIPALQFGVNVPSPILTVEEAKFPPFMLRAMKEIKFFGPSCIQSVIWPSVIRHRSVVAIAPPHSGKTVGYVVPLVSDYMKSPKIPRGNGPISVILCSSWKKVLEVYDLFEIFLGEKKLRITTLFAAGGSSKYKVFSAANGCEILITLPHCLLQCFENDAVNLSRCRNFIVDDATKLFNHHRKELKNIVLHFINTIKDNIVLPEFIWCAERWNDDFLPLLNKVMSKPLLYFTSFLESAIFAKIPILDHVCKSSEKKRALLGTLKDSAKVVICTTDMDQAIDIHRFLRCEGVKTYLVNEEMEHYISDEVINDWKCARSSSSHCLVITDQALTEMCISKADCLIHYDIPHKSRLQFGNRFSCIAEHFQDEVPKGLRHPGLSEASYKKQVEKSKCLCHVFVTESDQAYASHLMEIIENSGGKPSEELKELCLKHEKVDNTSASLCHYLKAFGVCENRRCAYRHVIDSVKDKPQIVPSEGDIEGVITHVLDASHYYMRVTKYLDLKSNQFVSLYVERFEIGFQLRDHYLHISKDLRIKEPVIGGTYVMKDKNKLFYRIKVLEKVVSHLLSELSKWKVLFLDEGWIKCCENLELYEINDKIELPPPLAVEVYLCGVRTPDSASDWNPQTTRFVADMIKNIEVSGKIVLCLGSALWLNPVVVRSKLSCVNAYANILRVDQKLKDSGHAKDNKNHIARLYKVCADKVPFPTIRKPKVEEETVEEPYIAPRAFLNCGTYEDVYVSSVRSPHQFYVQRAKFVDCLDDLLNNINKRIEKRQLQRSSAFYSGMHCIAPFYEDDRYYRAVIKNVNDADVHVFYVDFGDFASVSKQNIYVLPPELLLLPFQAIECEIAGITAAHGGWTDSAINTLYDLTRDEAGDMKILQLKAYSKSNSYEGGNHYVVDLWYSEKSLSEQLLQDGLIIATEPPVNSTTKTDTVDQDNCDKSSDSEAHPEDRDREALFFGVLSQMLLKENQCPNSNVTITEVTSEDESFENKKSKRMVPKLTSDCLRNEVQALALHHRSSNVILKPFSENAKPLITWWDTPEQLNIFINLMDVKIYNLDMDDEGFKFSTVLSGTEYATVEKFYAKVHSSNAKIHQTGQGINVTVKKCTPFKWPRFTQEKKKFLHIKYDLIHIDDSDTEEESTCINNIENNYIDEKDESSDDEYADSWEKISKYHDPYNPLP